MRTNAVIACVIFLSLLAPSLGRALVSNPVSDLSMVAHSDFIVRGTVTNIEYWTPSQGRVNTLVHLKLHEVLKGLLPFSIKELTLRQLGGREGSGAFYFIPGTPRFSKGEQVIVFLRKR